LETLNAGQPSDPVTSSSARGSHSVLRPPVCSLLVSDVLSGPLVLSDCPSMGLFSGSSFGEIPVVVKSPVRVKSK